MNLDEIYYMEKEKIRLKYGKKLKELYDEIKIIQINYLKNKNQIFEKYDNIENIDKILNNL